MKRLITNALQLHGIYSLVQAGLGHFTGRNKPRPLWLTHWRRGLALSLPIILGLAIVLSGTLLLDIFARNTLRAASANGGSSGVITRTTTADFQVCSALTGTVPTPTFTNTITSDALGGEIRLAASLEDYFAGDAVDLTRWITGTAYDWYTVPPSVANGVLTLDSAYLRSQANFQPLQPRFFEAYAQERINSSPAGWPDLGFYRELYPLDPNAITDTSSIRLFITRDDNSSFVRARNGGESAPLIDQDIAVIDLTQYHLFRIEWDITETRYYVDGVLEATITGTTSLNTWVLLYQQTPSTFEGGYSPIRVDWVRAGQYSSSGQYDSCVQDAEGVVNWTTLNTVTSAPTGTGVLLRTRTSANGSVWTAWSAPMTSTLITSPSGRYLQYRTELTTTNAMRSPELRQVSLSYFGPTSLQVSPASVLLDPGTTQTFSAQAYDVNSRAVSGLNYTWGLINGGGNLNATGLFTATITAGTYLNTISATVSTTGGPVTGFASVTVRDAPPLANPGGPYTMIESASITLTASGSDPNGLPVVFAWDLDNNAVFETAGQTASFSQPDNGLFTVRLRVTENGGASLSTTVTTTVTVTNAAPTATFSATPTSLAEGSSFTLVLTDPFDLGETDRLVGFTHSFDCGGGGGYGSFGVSNLANCVTGDNGVRTVRGRIQDKDGGIGEYTRTVTVTNVAPSVSIVGAPGSSPEGSAITLTSVLTDPGTLDTHTYVWGVTKNSSPYASGTAAGLSFTPNDNGTYVVSLTATDDDGGVGAASNVTVTVTNVPPVVTLGASVALNEGDTLTRTGSYTDAGADTHTANVNYGDGSGSQALSLNGDRTFGLNHLYSTSGAYTTTVTITDSDGSPGSGALAIAVNNVAPTILAVTNTGPITPGMSVTITVLATDPGGLSDPLQYAFDCNNDLVYETGPQAANFSTCAFLMPGTFTVSVRVNDPENGAAIGATAVLVNPYRVYLPVVFNNSTADPDIVVADIQTSTNALAVVIRNQGAASVRDPFWVDLYVDPAPPPGGVNQIWSDGRSARGAVWAVSASALPMWPGEALTLTIGGPYYRAAFSNIAGAYSIGTQLYVQVDSANANSTHGAVLEAHERHGQAYNNIHNSTLDNPLVLSAGTGGDGDGIDQLPSRPLTGP